MSDGRLAVVFLFSGNGEVLGFSFFLFLSVEVLGRGVLWRVVLCDGKVLWGVIERWISRIIGDTMRRFCRNLMHSCDDEGLSVIFDGLRCMLWISIFAVM